MHAAFDTLISDLTECLNFSLVYCEMQYLDFLGILQDHSLNSLWHLKNNNNRWDNKLDIKYRMSFLRRVSMPHDKHPPLFMVSPTQKYNKMQ